MSSSESSGSQEPDGKKPHATIRQRLGSCPAWFRHWKWEFCALSITCASLLAIVATLYPHQGKPLPDWPMRISVNALLSVYSLMFKGTLLLVVTSCIGQLQWKWFATECPLYDLVLYDNATRGISGSIRLLWAQRLRQPLTALGALITIAAIAIDPFFQQLIIPQDCSIAFAQENATLPRTNFADKRILSLDDTATLLNSRIYSLETGIVSQCPTGNCTFSEIYSTLGFCSYCEDISATIAFEHRCYENNGSIGGWPTNIYDTGHCPSGRFENITSTLPSGFSYNFLSDIPPDEAFELYNVSMSWDAFGLAFGFLNLSAETLLGKNSFYESGFDILTLEDSTGGCGKISNKNTWGCRGFGAASCKLQPCIRQYNASIVAGRLTERLLETSGPVSGGYGVNDLLYEEKFWSMIDTGCLQAEESQLLSEYGYHLNGTSQWLPFNITAPGSVQRTEWTQLLESLLKHQCLFLIGEELIEDIYMLLSSFLTGSLKGTILEVNGWVVKVGLKGPQILQYMYDSGRMDFEGIQKTYMQMAEGATDYIRTHGNASHSDPAIGQVQHYAACLVVRWLWITFPAVIALITLLFFLAVVATAATKQGIPVWKSSPLAWICHVPHSLGWPDQESQERLSHTKEEMEEEARGITVKLVREPNLHIQLFKDSQSREPDFEEGSEGPERPVHTTTTTQEVASEEPGTLNQRLEDNELHDPEPEEQNECNHDADLPPTPRTVSVETSSQT